MNELKSINEVTVKKLAKAIEADWKADNTDEARALLNSQVDEIRDDIVAELSLACRMALK